MKLIKSPVIRKPKPKPIEPKRPKQESFVPDSEVDSNDMYDTCRWCKYYDKGQCYNDKAFDLDGESIEDTIQYAYEESDMNIALEEEGLSESLLVRLEVYFTKKSFKENHEEMTDIIKNFLYDEVADFMIEVLQAGASNSDQKGVGILEPTDFKCKYFW